MKEITFVCPTSKLTRAIKLCETQDELVDVIHKRRKLKNGYVYVIYKNGGYFSQLLSPSGYKTNHFKRYGIKSATVSSSSGEFFVFGDFAITPDGCVFIGEENIKKYGLYYGQYDVNPEKAEIKTENTKTKTENAKTKTENTKTKTENAKTKTETKTKTKTKIIINMEHFEDDINYFMEHFNDEYGYQLIILD